MSFFKRKSKRTERQRLIAQLDTIFSLYIRLREKRRNFGVCYICNCRPTEQCFHFLSRGNYATRWEPDNACGSCRGCNYNESVDRRQANKDRFRKIHIKMVGDDRVREVEEMARREAKFTNEQLRLMVSMFRKMMESRVL